MARPPVDLLGYPCRAAVLARRARPGEVPVTFDESVRILKGPRRSGVDGYIEYVHASAVYYANHMARTDHPVADAAPRDADGLDAALDRYYGNRAKPMRMHDAIRPDYGNEGDQTPMGAAPDPLAVGAEMMFELPDDNFRYFVSKSNAGKVALFRHRVSEGASTHYTAPTNIQGLMRDAQARDELRQITQRSIAAQVRDFWSKQSNAA